MRLVEPDLRASYGARVESLFLARLKRDVCAMYGEPQAGPPPARIAELIRRLEARECLDEKGA